MNSISHLGEFFETNVDYWVASFPSKTYFIESRHFVILTGLIINVLPVSWIPPYIGRHIRGTGDTHHQIPPYIATRLKSAIGRGRQTLSLGI